MLHSDTFYAFLITAISLAVVATILARLQIPTIVGFVLTGIFIGPSGLNWIQSLPAAHTIAELGVIFLMFSLGLEVSFDHLKKMFRPFLQLGALQVFGTIAIAGSAFYYGFSFSFAKSFVLGSCLALSSTAIVLKLLQEKRETETPYGRVGIIVLLFQDIVCLPLMAVIPFLAAQSDSYSTMTVLKSISVILFFFIGCYLMGRYLIPRVFAEVSRTGSREVFFFSLISMTFVISVLAESVGLSMSLGAFVAGVLISESPYNKQALAEFGPLRDIFLGFFFSSVGMLLDLNFFAENIVNLLWLIPSLFLLKFFIIYSIVRYNSHSHGVSFASALILTQIGEFSFVLATSAHGHGLLGADEFQYFLALAVTSMLFTPLMFSFGLKGSAHSSWEELGKSLRNFSLRRSMGKRKLSAANPLPVEASEDSADNDPMLQPRQTVVIGLGHAGERALQELTANGIPCVGVDLNLENVTRALSQGYDARYGDCTRPEVLEALRIREAHLAIITVSGKHVTPQVLAMIRNINPSLRVLARIHYLQDKSLIRDTNGHETEVIVSEEETAHSVIHRALNYYHIE